MLDGYALIRLFRGVTQDRAPSTIRVDPHKGLPGLEEC